MFKDGVLPDFIPERIYDLICLTSKKRVTSKEAAEFLEPLTLNNIHEYYQKVLNASIELGLIKKDDDYLCYIGGDECIKSLDCFRKYCNSVVWKDEESLFFKITSAFVESNYEFLKYDNITSPLVNVYIMKHTNDRNADVKRLRGHRFWLSFLGIGLIQERNEIYFLPNMCVAMRDFIALSSIERNKEYTIREFFNIISEVGKICITTCMKDLKLSAAISNALRTLHDSKEIELERLLDSKEVWSMIKSDVHMYTDITHIIVRR